jgi:DNA-binding CsgD family transcriptional regulator
MMARRVTCPTFVGRDEELSRLDAVAEAATLESQLVLIGGDAGLGKTRLITEACARRRVCGGVTAIGGCVDLGDVGSGFAPLLEVLRSVRADLGAELLEGMLLRAAPELVPLLTGGSDGREVRQEAVLTHTLALFEELGEWSPGLLVVFEDLHWADASTRDLVAYLARNLRSAKVALVLSYRADDLHRRHPLRPLLVELGRSPTVERLQLTGMTRGELTVLLTGVAGSVPSDAIVDDLLHRSEGNPFYAEELFAAASRGGSLPATLREAILAGVTRLAEPVQAALREAAVLGGTIDERVLARMAGRSVPEVDSTLREAIAHQILVADGGLCRFRHALVREALYEELLPAERQRLHEAAAEAISTGPEQSSVPDHLRWALLAHHWGEAEDQPNAFAASVRAAMCAEQIGALADAADHYQRADQLWPRVPDPETAAGMQRSDLLVRDADAVSHAGLPSRAVSMVSAALDLLGNDSEPETRAIVLQRLGDHLWSACDSVGSGHAGEAAVALLAGRPPSEAQALALTALGRHQMLSDHFIDAEVTLRKALAVASATGSLSARGSALSAIGFALAKLGQVDEGVDALRESLAIAERYGTADDISRAYVNLSATLTVAIRCNEAADVARDGLEHARRAGMLASDGVLLTYNRAEALYLLGSWDAADELIMAGPITTERPHGSLGAVLVCRLAFHRGHSGRAAEYRDLALALLDKGKGAARAPEALTCAAQIAGRERRFEDARGHIADAMALVETTDDVLLATSIAAIGLAIEADRVEMALLRGRRGDAAAEEARVVADKLRHRVRTIVDRLDQRGFSLGRDAIAQLATMEAEHARVWGDSNPDHWAAVADRWDGLAFPYPAAGARLREAEAVLRSRGSRARASHAARLALSTADRLGAAPLAEQVRLLAQRGRLDLTESPENIATATDPLSELGVSQREREVLDLVAAGRTNRQIADALYISHKTASVHVTHLLCKLGVASRIEAAALAQRLGLGASPPDA